MRVNDELTKDLGDDKSTMEDAISDDIPLACPADESEEEREGSKTPVTDNELIASLPRAEEASADAASSYLRRIGRTPLLTPQEEATHFKQFEAARSQIAKLLANLPPSILEKVRAQEKARNPKSKAKDDTWWRPMNIPLILEQIQKEMQAYRNAAGQDANEDNLAELWTALNRAAERMQTEKQKIVQANLLLVASVAKAHLSRAQSLSFLDLMQEGSIGLMKAIERFDLQRGYRFSTYATWWVMQSIRRTIDQQGPTIRVPCYIGEKRRSIVWAQAQLSQTLEREPSIREIAEAVEMTEDRVIELFHTAKGTISLDSPLSTCEDMTVSNFVADASSTSPEENLVHLSKREAVEKALGSLTSREALVIKLRFGLIDETAHTLADIGRQIGTSRERVRQIQQEALRKLRHPVRAQYLKELL